MTLKILKKEDYKASKWSGGDTTEIFIYPEDSTLEDRNFIFRISTATSPENKSIFSDFSGYYRYITTLDNKLKIIHNDEEKVLSPYKIFYFDGKDEAYSASSVTDFNLILKKGYAATYRTESICEKVELNFGEGIKLIFIPEGNIKMSTEDGTSILKKLETVLIQNEETKITLESIDNNYTKVIIIEVEVD